MSRSPEATALLEGCTRDGILGGRLALWQPRQGYRFAVDAPLLAHFAAEGRRGASGRAADLGAGCGVVGLAFAIHCPGWQVDLVELQPRLAALCAENATGNDLAHRVTAHAADARALRGALPGDAFELVASNPPFHRAGAGRASPDPERAAAHAELTLTVEALAGAAARLLRPRGALAVIFSAERLPALLAACDASRLAPVRLRAVHPLPGAPARRVLLEARKGVATPLVLEPPLFVHDSPGRYSAEAAAILGETPPGDTGAG